MLASLNICSVYLIAYYGRIVVDKVLVITSVKKPPVVSPVRRTSIPARDRARLPHLLPDRGGESEQERVAQASPRPPGAMGKLMAMFAVYALTLFLLNVSARFAEHLRIRVSQRIIKGLREDIHQKVLSLSRSYHQAHTPGRLMARMLSDVNILQTQMFRTIVDTSCYIMMFLVGIAILLVLEWRVALFVFCVMIPYMLTIRTGRNKIGKVNREIRHTNACLWGLASQKLDNIKAIFAYGRERHEYLNFHRLSSCLIRDVLHHQRLGAGLNRVAQIIASASSITILLYCTRLVLNESMTLGKMMYIYGIAANLFTPILGLTRMSVVVTNMLVVLDRVIQIFNEPLEIEEAPGAVAFPSPLNSGIALRNLTFRYSPDSESVLRNITFEIPAGKWICIMGPSGSGKSTLLHLLARLHDPSSGDILVDGIPLSGIKFSSLRRHMALVSQEPQIFSGTIRDNIIYGYVEAEPSQIMAAAKASDSHKFIMKLPVKYETTVGEKGITLSGGQRQRISIARALLTNPEVLLLDDCTSALDADTERRIQVTLSRLLVGKTAAIVSQRVSMAMRCDRICVLENGIITEAGTHKELLDEGGFYARLFARQTG